MKKTAQIYDRLLKVQSCLFGCWEPAERRRLARLLGPPRGGLILEVAVGTGANLTHLAAAAGAGKYPGRCRSFLGHAAAGQAAGRQTPQPATSHLPD